MLRPLLYLLLLVLYIFLYAPYGANETDGGFLTGLAWHLHFGQHLYTDVIYVRPPVPVWLRWATLELLPQEGAIWWERALFYLQFGLYSLAGAAALVKNDKKWLLAAFAFVVSVHSYPAASWHTTDGIFFAAVGIYCLTLSKAHWVLLGGFLLGLGILCKQSFYPLLVLPVWVFWMLDRREGLWLGLGMFLSLAGIGAVLYWQGTLSGFFNWTRGSATLADAFQHGVLDYFRINPWIGLPVVLALLPVLVWVWKPGQVRPADGLMGGLVTVFLLMAWLVVNLYQRQDFTAPFAPSRVLFWIGAVYGVWLYCHQQWTRRHFAIWAMLMAVSWTASVSWGCNLPILFALPYMYAVSILGNALWKAAFPQRKPAFVVALLLALLLGVFGYAYTFVYRDGRRSDMSRDMGAIFPQLKGIRSSPESAALYADLKKLGQKYPHFKTLPSFPQSNYLCGSVPALPLDWVVQREMNGRSGEIKPDSALVYFVEKSYGDRIQLDPELLFTKEMIEKTQILEETPFFWVRKK